MRKNEKPDFWTGFQAYLKNSIPENIVKVLNNAGYDNAISVSEIEDKDILIIEEHVRAHKNQQLLVEELQAYANVTTFSFLPGHRKLLLALPQKVHSFKNKKCKKNLFNSSKKDAQCETVEEVELPNEQDVKQLKENLLKRLNKSGYAVRINAVFVESNIVSEIEIYICHSVVAKSKTAYKCLIKCTDCETKIPCTHNGYWQIGNLEKHFRTKHSVRSAENISKNISSTTEKIYEPKNISKSVDAELNNILNSDDEISV